MRTYQQHGLKIDITAIANGIWDMLPRDDKACFTLGMAPAIWMERVETLMKQKLENLAGIDPAVQYGGVSLTLKKDIVKDIMHEFYLGLLDCAKAEGVLQV